MPEALSPREYQVFERLVRGKRIAEIAEELDISVLTARSYQKTMYKKLHVHRQVDLMDAFANLPGDSEPSHKLYRARLTEEELRLRRLCYKLYGQALRIGFIKRPERCSSDGCNCVIGIEGHHTNYNRPLDVVWLCSKHHDLVHHQQRLALYQIET